LFALPNVDTSIFASIEDVHADPPILPFHRRARLMVDPMSNGIRNSGVTLCSITNPIVLIGAFKILLQQG
jgi:hypothetical protein